MHNSARKPRGSAERPAYGKHRQHTDSRARSKVRRPVHAGAQPAIDRRHRQWGSQQADTPVAHREGGGECGRGEPIPMVGFVRPRRSTRRPSCVHPCKPAGPHAGRPGRRRPIAGDGNATTNGAGDRFPCNVASSDTGVGVSPRRPLLSQRLSNASIRDSGHILAGVAAHHAPGFLMRPANVVTLECSGATLRACTARTSS